MEDLLCVVSKVTIVVLVSPNREDLGSTLDISMLLFQLRYLCDPRGCFIAIGDLILKFSLVISYFY